MRYCEGCWAGRKSWLPDRPKPRSRRQRDARREWRLQQRRDRRQFKHGSSDEMDGKDAGRARSDSDSGFSPQELAPENNFMEVDKKTPVLEYKLMEVEKNITFLESTFMEVEKNTPVLENKLMEVGIKTPVLDNKYMEVKKNKAGSLELGVIGKEPTIMMPPTPLCMMCYQRPKNASLIHGRIGHQVRLQPPFWYICLQCSGSAGFLSFLWIRIRIKKLGWIQKPFKAEKFQL